MKTLLLFVPSAVAIAVLMWHAWSYRGRRIALSFFISAFLFGVVRGNVIHWITVESQGGVMPYVFTQPVVQIFSASLQAIIGWIFSLYVSWWLAERVLARIPALKGDLMATVGMACVGMAAVGYGVEGGAAAAGWWLWSIPTYNRFFVGVPTVGIAEWFAVGFEFFIPYFLVFCTPYRRRVWAHALWGVFLFHMFLHLFSEPLSRSVPTQPFVLWHWISILTLGILALTGAGSTTVETAESKHRSRHELMWVCIGLFTAVMVIAQVGIGGRPDMLISLIPLGLLCLMALPKVSMPYILVSAVVAWIAEGFGTGFVAAPVAAVLFLQRRAQWGRQWLFRVGVVALFVGIGWGVYRSGVALSQTVRGLHDASGASGAPRGKQSDGHGRARTSSSRRAGPRGCRGVFANRICTGPAGISRPRHCPISKSPRSGTNAFHSAFRPGDGPGKIPRYSGCRSGISSFNRAGTPVLRWPCEVGNAIAQSGPHGLSTGVFRTRGSN